MIRVKRFYDTPSKEDDERFLAERLWPRRLTREAAALSGWLKDLDPSPSLRRWFGHDVEHWDEFQQRYAAEPQAADKQTLLHQLAAATQHKTVTLVFAARDTQHNSAVVLKQIPQQQYLG